VNQLLNVSASMRFKKIKIISLNETAARFMTSGSLNIWGRMRAFPADLRRTNGRLKLQGRILGKATIVFIRKPCIPSKRELGRGCTGFYLYTNTVFFFPPLALLGGGWFCFLLSICQAEQNKAARREHFIVMSDEPEKIPWERRTTSPC